MKIFEVAEVHFMDLPEEYNDEDDPLYTHSFSGQLIIVPEDIDLSRYLQNNVENLKNIDFDEFHEGVIRLNGTESIAYYHDGYLLRKAKKFPIATPDSLDYNFRISKYCEAKAYKYFIEYLHEYNVNKSENIHAYIDSKRTEIGQNINSAKLGEISWNLANSLYDIGDIKEAIKHFQVASYCEEFEQKALLASLCLNTILGNDLQNDFDRIKNTDRNSSQYVNTAKEIVDSLNAEMEVFERYGFVGIKENEQTIIKENLGRYSSMQKSLAFDEIKKYFHFDLESKVLIQSDSGSFKFEVSSITSPPYRFVSHFESVGFDYESLLEACIQFYRKVLS